LWVRKKKKKKEVIPPEKKEKRDAPVFGQHGSEKKSVLFSLPTGKKRREDTPPFLMDICWKRGASILQALWNPEKERVKRGRGGEGGVA